ncbi:MAG: hypothetical protein WA326_02035 [Nitrososphaeraceae archaeon]
MTATITLRKDSLLYDRKLETVTEGLSREYTNLLNKISKEDAITVMVMDYMISLETEVNQYYTIK